MAKTKNTTRCTKPRHKKRVSRKHSVVSKSNKSGRLTHKRGEGVDFGELSHTVTKGNYAGFKGKLLGKTSEGNVTFCLLINPRGKPVKEATEIVVHESFLTDVNSNDMIALVGVGVEGQEEEDPKLVAYEKTTWMCNKCNGVNSNDGSMCINLVGGKVCAAIKPSDGNILGWGDCFKVSCVIFFVLIWNMHPVECHLCVNFSLISPKINIMSEAAAAARSGRVDLRCMSSEDGQGRQKLHCL